MQNINQKILMRKKHNAFSLVELSIVIIILGLLIASITVGRDLIRASKIRNLVTQLSSYSTAMNTFEMKYSAMPGDISNPSRRGLGSHAGDGDGLIEDSDGGDPDLADNELVYFWEHLNEAGFINGSYDGDSDNGALGETFPEVKIGGGITIYGLESTQNNYFHIGIQDSQDGEQVFANVFVPEDAFSLDNKFDDGFPLRGIVIARTVECTSGPTEFSCANDPITTTNEGASTTAGETCVYQVSSAQDDNEDEYDFETTATKCNLRIEIK
jgi:prepilin-type N-terminal cleavage/methylation domain-containing protein